MSDKRYSLYIISDGTGETASQMVRAGLVQYANKDINIVKCKNVRTEKQVEPLLTEIEQNGGGIVVFTVASRILRKYILESAAKHK
jgi:regulator of PEP synthase PpsR (kinase-PPPase family)